MISINAHDFCAYDETLFLEFLLIHELTEFEVSFTRRYFKEYGLSVTDDYYAFISNNIISFFKKVYNHLQGGSAGIKYENNLYRTNGIRWGYFIFGKNQK